jgi:hypothetical protein
MLDTPAACREEAQRVRAEALEAPSAVIKERLLQIAENYEQLARFFEALEQADATAATSSLPATSAAADAVAAASSESADAPTPDPLRG